MFDQRLTQKQLQKLSPQQIQLMKLLQIPTVNLDQRIQEELESNPALEELRDDSSDDESFGQDNMDSGDTSTAEDNFDEGDDDDNDREMEEVSLDEFIEDYVDDDDTIADYKLQASNYSPDEEQKTMPMAVENSFFDYLEEQLGMLDLDDREHTIAEQLIGSIDEDGYIRRDITLITDDLAFSQNVHCTVEDVVKVLELVQSFDPPGIGARDLRECLILQLTRKKETSENANHKVLDNAVIILDKHFEEFTKKHFDKLRRSLGITEEQLKASIDLILKLNPKPASGYTSENKASRNNVQYIVPDFIINNVMGELELVLNSKNAPDLRVNDYYKDMLRSYSESSSKSKKEKEAVMFIKQKIDSAKWFIEAIRQRQVTMFNTMYSIMQYQKEYFLTGDEKKIRPMILKDIADITGLDISTISRVANSKYVQTEFGTKRLKEFFSESIQTDSGEEVSTVEVKNILTELVNGEDKRKPISDEKLREILAERGYNIARRTVAKYREQLNIPVARLRKEL